MNMTLCLIMLFYNSEENSLTNINKILVMKILKKLINFSNAINVIDAIVLWNMKLAFQNFQAQLALTGVTLNEKIFVPPFTKFWNTVIMENLEKFDHPIFKNF